MLTAIESSLVHLRPRRQLGRSASTRNFDTQSKRKNSALAGEVLSAGMIHTEKLPHILPAEKGNTANALVSRPHDTGLTLYLIDAGPKEKGAILGGRRKLRVKSSFMKIREVKVLIQNLLKIPVAFQRLYFRGSSELRDHRTLEESGIHASGSTLLFTTKQDFYEKRNMLIEAVGTVALHGAELPPRLKRTILKVRRSLDINRKAPQLALDGTGGTYFLFDLDGRPAACFKPADEEPFCINNPRQFLGPYGAPSIPNISSTTITSPSHPKLQTTDLTTTTSSSIDDLSSDSDVSTNELHHDNAQESSEEDEAIPWLAMRQGVRPGEAYLREVAAYLLDASANFLARVPETTLAECAHAKFQYSDRVVREKIGSLQVYAYHDGVAEDYGLERLDVARIQAVAALDIRALNCDRNPSNILVRRTPNNNVLDLIPIDHGYCLPDVLDIEWFDWCWLDWPQCAAPLDDTVRSAILNIDPLADALKLREALGLRPECLRLAAAAGLLLQLGVRAGLTLRDVASLIVVTSSNDIQGVSADTSLATSRKKRKSKLANSIDRAHELAALALRDHRSRTAEPPSLHNSLQPPIPQDEAKQLGDTENNVSSSSLVLFGSEAKDQLSLTISISPVKNPTSHSHRHRVAHFEKELDDISNCEAKRMSESHELGNLLPGSDASWSPSSSSEASISSQKLDTQKFDHDSLSGGAPLVRLRSCPALVDDENKNEDLLPTPPDFDYRRLDLDAETDYDRQFFHFLHGLLNDLIRWKCHHRD